MKRLRLNRKLFLSAKSFGGTRIAFATKAGTPAPVPKDPVSAQDDLISLTPLTRPNGTIENSEVQRLREEIVQLKQQNERWQRVALELQDMVGEEAVKGEAGVTGTAKPKKRRKKR